MARRRAARTLPDWMAYQKARDARSSVLHVIAKTSEQDEGTGEDKTCIRSGSSFVIKVNHQPDESIVLTCEHVVSGELIPDGLTVRFMHPHGVMEFPAHIIHLNADMDVAVLRVPGLTAARPLRFSRDEPVISDGIIAVGYCNPTDFFDEEFTYCSIPAIHPGRVREIVTDNCVQQITLYHVLLSCVGVQGMSGGPIVSRTGIVGMTTGLFGGYIDGQFAGCTDTVHPRTILGVLKSLVGVPPQVDMTMEEVINFM